MAYRWVEVRHAKHAEKFFVGLFAQGAAFVVDALLDGFLVEVALVLAKRVSHSIGCLAKPQHTQTNLLKHSVVNVADLHHEKTAKRKAD